MTFPGELHLVIPRVAIRYLNLSKGKYDETFAGEDGRIGEMLRIACKLSVYVIVSL